MAEPGNVPPASLGPRRLLLHSLLFLGCVLLAVFIYAWAFLNDKLFLRDFGGASAWLWKVTRWCSGAEPFSLWVRDFFCGQPWIMILPTLLWFLMYVPFALLWGPVLGLKIGILFHLALAGFTMFLFVRSYLRSTPAAWLAGFAYALHPIHVDLVARWGLTNFPVFYPYVPLLAMLVVKLARQPSARLCALTALVGALAFWADFQRPFVSYPFLAVLFVVEVLRQQQTKGQIYFQGPAASAERVRENSSDPFSSRPARAWACAALSCVLMLALLAALLAGALVEKKDLTLVPSDQVASEQEASSLKNPFYPFDRDGDLTTGWIGLAPPAMTYNAGTYYFGLVSLAAGVLALLVGARGLAKKTVGLFFLLAVAAYWISCGVYSVFDTVALFVGPIVNDPLVAFRAGGFLWLIFLLILGGALALILAFSRLRARLGEGAILVGCLAASLFLFGKPFVWLVRCVPFYGNMRSPTWFAAVIPAFASAVVLAAGASALADAAKIRRRAAGVFLVAFVLLAVDVWPYRDRFDVETMYAREFGSPDCDPAKGLGSIARWLSTDAKDGRWVAADPYSPLADALSTYSGRPSAWAWLNWSSAAGLGRFFESDDGVFACLMDRKRLARATDLLGVANVRYVLASPVYLRNRAVLDSPELPPAHVDENWIVLENPRWRPYVQVYEWQDSPTPSIPQLRDRPLSADAQVRDLRVRDGDIAVSVSVPRRSLVVVSESWYPYWRAFVDGRAIVPAAAEGAFLCVPLDPGDHRVEFRYRVGAHVKAGLIVTLAALAIVVLLIVKPGMRKS
ncbi:MAG: hypothetical protein V2A58_08685 [Planctomycetota bacterium]